jgi:hypothetical protein
LTSSWAPKFLLENLSFSQMRSWLRLIYEAEAFYRYGESNEIQGAVRKARRIFRM